MNRMQSEWQRLFAADSPQDDRLTTSLIDAVGRTRALVIEWGRPADWRTLATLWHESQSAFDWPAPLIAVNGKDAFQLWFPLAHAVPVELAHQVAAAMVARWLPQSPADALARRAMCWPEPGPDGVWRHAQVVPARMPGHEVRWSAFVSPDLAAVFDDEPVLDLEPGRDAQADLMVRHRCIDEAAWARACQILLSDVTPAVPVPVPESTGDMTRLPLSASSALAGPYGDPAEFLRAVMNHPAVPLAQRIKAARALLAK
ncbi:MAG: hypothetical protein R3E94_14160 [Burkholderiaceae bacterium]